MEVIKTLANIKSAIKRAELNVKQNNRNSAQKSAMRSAIKAFEANPNKKTSKSRFFYLLKINNVF